MRTLSTAAKTELFKPHGSVALNCLLDLDFNDEERHYHADTTKDDVTVRGTLYRPRMHIISMPHDRADGVVENVLVIDNSDGDLTSYFSSSNVRGTIKNRYVFNNDFATTILGPFEYESLRAQPDESQGIVTVRVQYSRTLREPFPSLIFNPTYFPGLF